MGVPKEGSGIEVYLDGLRDMAKQLRHESEKVIKLNLRTAQDAMAFGSPFGTTSESGYVYAAKYRYDQAARRVLRTMNEYALMAEALATAAEAIADRYGDADGLSAAKSADVDREYRTALAAAKARQPKTTSQEAV